MCERLVMPGFVKFVSTKESVDNERGMKHENKTNLQNCARSGSCGMLYGRIRANALGL